MSGEERRTRILEIIDSESTPIAAQTLAKMLLVSRQVIVGDIAILRASGHEIIATPRGYVADSRKPGIRFKIATRHTPDRTREELEIIVDNGGTVVDVCIEHKIYGELIGKLDISSRYDIDAFLDKLDKSNSHSLSDLTDGIHLHSIICPSPKVYEKILMELDEAGILLKE